MRIKSEYQANMSMQSKVQGWQLPKVQTLLRDRNTQRMAARIKRRGILIKLSWGITFSAFAFMVSGNPYSPRRDLFCCALIALSACIAGALSDTQADDLEFLTNEPGLWKE